MLTEQKVYVLYSSDAPGFFATSDTQKVFGSAYLGFENDLITQATQLVSSHYLNSPNAIQVIWSEKTQTAKINQTQNGFYSHAQNYTAKITQSTTIQQFGDNVHSRGFHFTAAGHPVVPMFTIGNFGCGTIV